MEAYEYIRKQNGISKADSVRDLSYTLDIDEVVTLMEGYVVVKNNVALSDVIGCALVKGKLVDVTVIDERKLKQEGVVRIMWVNKDGKRTTSFVEENEVKKYGETQ